MSKRPKLIGHGPILKEYNYPDQFIIKSVDNQHQISKLRRNIDFEVKL